MRPTKLLIFSFFGLLLLLIGCGTTNQATFPKQAFHDLTSRYNAHFNVSDKLNGIFKLSEQYHKDKFDSVIPVYYYSDPKEFSSYSGDLEDIIKRSTTAIQLHSVSNWSDDHFLLIGMAFYLKGDYDKAENTFKYITSQYKEGVDYVKVMRALGKKVGKYQHSKRRPPKQIVKSVPNPDGSTTLQKVDNRPEKSIWIHTPARSEALLWLIKTHIRQGRYDDASAVVTYVRGDNLFYKNFDHDLDLVEADLRVSEKKYAAAIVPLEKYLNAKKVVHNKHLRLRPLFVLAQCYAATGNYAKAVQNYELVLKSHPGYDMEFYAKIKMAKLGRGGASSGNIEMRTLLSRMAKDGKYKEYWDQVYYELALISLGEKDKVQAIKYLKQSIQNSIGNEDQKAQSYLKIAELAYQDEDYVTAKFYYDSTAASIPKSDPHYPEIQERDKMLANLVKQLSIIAQEDSLQKLAALPKDQQEKVVRNAIARKEKEEEEKKAKADQEKQQQQLNSFQNGNQPGTNPLQNPGAGGQSWYFYNTAAKGAGYNDFVKKWGKRALEENWRRKNKVSTNTDDDNAATTDTAATKKDSAAASTIKAGTPEEQLMAGIPNTPEKLAKSVDKIVDAYYTAGTVYKDGLDAYGKAGDIFENLNSHYPKHKLLLESYYNLYLIALKKGDKEKTEHYKQLILAEFPESVIAKILRDPNYVNQAKGKEQEADNYYQSAYRDYEANKLDSAWYKCEMSDVVLKPNPLASKFQLLQALILAKQNRLTDYIQMLNKIINKSTDAAIKKLASDLLAALNKSSLPQVDLSKDPARRDSLNAIGAISTGPDTSNSEILRKLNEAKQKAIQNGTYKVDTSQKALPVASNTQAKDTTSKTAATTTTVTDTSKNKPSAPTEDTTSVFKRADDAPHYFIVYIKDEAVSHSAETSVRAKLDAYNSTMFADKKLQLKIIFINSSNRILSIRQFKNKADAMPYYKALQSQGQLFSDLQAGQYNIAIISVSNSATLVDQKNIDDYMTFFKRVYK